MNLSDHGLQHLYSLVLSFLFLLNFLNIFYIHFLPCILFEFLSASLIFLREFYRSFRPYFVFLPSFLFSLVLFSLHILYIFLPSFLLSFLLSFLPSFLPSFYPSFHLSILPSSFYPSFLPSILPSSFPKLKSLITWDSSHLIDHCSVQFNCL